MPQQCTTGSTSSPGAHFLRLSPFSLFLCITSRLSMRSIMQCVCNLCTLASHGLCSSMLLGCARASCLHTIVHCRKNASQPVMQQRFLYADRPSGGCFICAVACGCADDWPVSSDPPHWFAVGLAPAPEACTGKVHSQNVHVACYGCLPEAAHQIDDSRTCSQQQSIS